MPTITTLVTVTHKGVRIDGAWYWGKGLYGVRGEFFAGDTGSDTVDIYSMDGEFICKAGRV